MPSSSDSSLPPPQRLARRERKHAQKELRRAQRRVKRWEKKAQEVAKLRAECERERPPPSVRERSPMRSLKEVQSALSALPTLDLPAKRARSRSRSRECSRGRRSPKREDPPAPRKAPPKTCANWCEATGVLKLSLSAQAAAGLARLASLTARRAAVNVDGSGDGDAAERAAPSATAPFATARAAVPPKAERRVEQTLPAAKQRAAFLKALDENTSLVVQGDTGCGKTTQLPQFLLEDAAERGQPCRIWVTQPRRVSAISVARRVCWERQERLGQSVGYSIRLDSSSCGTCLTYCTVGVLLRRLESDPDLQNVTHVFADEVHERSVEGDFLLLLLRELQKRRPELRVIAMSATLDAERLRSYFQAAILKLPGQMFPVKRLFLEDALELTKHSEFSASGMRIGRYKGGAKFSGTSGTKTEDLSNYTVKQRYSHLSSETRSTLAAMDPAVTNYDLAALLVKHFLTQKPPLGPDGTPLAGVLVFLSGAKEIQKMRAVLLELCPSLKKEPHSSWVLNLHSSLESEDQQQVFNRPPPGVRKIILATNIAETSITVDDVGVVIDTGRVKELRFDSGRQVASLEEVVVCRSSARQRKGRAGRVAPGICVHLVTKYCHEHLMEEHQEPEVRRVPLEQLLLRTFAAGLPELLGSAEKACQALLDPPDQRAVKSALLQLKRLGAVQHDGQHLSALGKQMSKLPLAPRLAKLALLGSHLGGAFREVAISAAAALSLANWPLSAGACSSSLEQRRFEARRSHRRLAEEVGFDLGCSDLLAALRGFGELQAQWEDRRLLAQELHLRLNSMQELAETRAQLCQDLPDTDLRQRHVGLGGDLGQCAPLLVGLLCSACSQIAVAIPKETLSSSFGSSGMSELFVQDETTGTLVPVQVHPSSVSAKEKLFGTPFVLYEELTESGRLFLRCVTPAPPLAVLLFAGLLGESGRMQSRPAVTSEAEKVLQLGPLQVQISRAHADQILETRRSLERFFRREKDQDGNRELEVALLELLRQPTELS